MSAYHPVAEFGLSKTLVFYLLSSSFFLLSFFNSRKLHFHGWRLDHRTFSYELITWPATRRKAAGPIKHLYSTKETVTCAYLCLLEGEVVS